MTEMFDHFFERSAILLNFDSQLIELNYKCYYTFNFKGKDFAYFSYHQHKITCIDECSFYHFHFILVSSYAL